MDTKSKDSKYEGKCYTCKQFTPAINPKTGRKYHYGICGKYGRNKISSGCRSGTQTCSEYVSKT